MSDAPERIWALPPAWRNSHGEGRHAGTWLNFRPDHQDAANGVEYVRADRASPISEETVAKLRDVVAHGTLTSRDPYYVYEVLRDILTELES